MDTYDYLFKCIIVGDGGAGKTAIVVRFSQGFFKEKYKLTIGVEFAVKNIALGGNVIKLQIWDTGGQDRFQYVRPLYYKGAMGCIVLFDLTNRESFDHIPRWLDEVQKEAGDVPMLLVGNKSDLTDQRVITSDEAKEIAKKLKMEYIESSAKTGNGVKDLFAALAYLMMGEKIPESFLSGAESINQKVTEPTRTSSQFNKKPAPIGISSTPPTYENTKPKPRGLPKDVFQKRLADSKIIQPLSDVQSSRPKPLSLEDQFNSSRNKYNIPTPPPPPSESKIKKKEQQNIPPPPPPSTPSSTPASSMSSDKFYNVLKKSVDKKMHETPNKSSQISARKGNSPISQSIDSQKQKSRDLFQNSPRPKTCPNCGSFINPNFKFCNRCGKRLS